MEHSESKDRERMQMPMQDLHGKAGEDAPGEHEIRRSEYKERVYENTQGKL